jgi:hypothetical protein
MVRTFPEEKEEEAEMVPQENLPVAGLYRSFCVAPVQSPRPAP